MTAAQIGSYCSDFIIQDPAASETASCYKRVHPATNRTFYLYIATNGNLTEIETPFVQLASALTHTQFQLTLTWNKSVKPVADTVSGTLYSGKDMRNITGNTYVVHMNTPTTLQIRRSTAGGDSVIATSGLKSFSSINDTIQEYELTLIPPYTVERSGTPVRLVDDDDNDRGVVKSSTTMRYLYIQPGIGGPPPDARIADLYTPGYTQNMINRVGYRINKKTNLEDSRDVRYTVDVYRHISTLNGFATNQFTSVYMEDPRLGITSGNVRGNSATDFLGTMVTFGGRTYVVTTSVDDKTVSDLFGDFSLGLFKLVNTANDTDSGLYLGYECKTVDASGSCSSSKTLVVKDYFIFRQPMYSCQFRTYNLGGENEYMMRVVDPDSTSSRVTVKVDANGALEFPTTDPNMDERGWTFVQQGVASGNRVKLKWNYSAETPPSSSVLDNSYLRIVDNVPSLNTEPNANTFICVKCTKIDPVTGTCSNETSMYIDDDMSISTAAVLSSPFSISGVPAITSRFTISTGSSPVTFANVFDDGANRFESAPIAGGTDNFFTTQAGITTLAQRLSPTPGVVFIGTTVSGGEILYAKLTGSSDTKFVRATPPTVEEGFGWIVTTPDAINKPTERKIVAYLDSTKGFMGNSPTTIYKFITNNPNIVVTSSAYDPETNSYPLTITTNPPSTSLVIRSLPSGQWVSVSSPYSGVPGTGYAFRGLGTVEQNALGTAETEVYVPPAPSVSITPGSTFTRASTFNSITVSGDVVTNIGDTNSTVVLTATPQSGGGAAITSAAVTYGTYRSGTPPTGVTVNTPSSATPITYNLGIVFTRTRGGSSVSASPAAIQTPAGPSIGTVTVSGSTVTFSVTGTGGGSLTPPIKYARKDAGAGAGSGTAPAANAGSVASPVWFLVGDSIVSTTAPVPTISAGNTGTVTMNIVPDMTTNYYYFFMVDTVVATAYISVQFVAIPTGSVKKITGSLPGDQVVTSGASPPSVTTVTFGNTPSIPVLRFNGSSQGMFVPIGTGSRSKVSLAFVFTLNVVNQNLKQLFGSYGFGTGSIHLVFNSNARLTVALSGAGNWGGGGNNDWEPAEPAYEFSANTPYMLILTADTSTKTIRLRLNGGNTIEKTYSGAISNFLDVLGGSSYPTDVVANRITLGDWISDSTRGHRYFNGDIADFVFYDKVLTNTEIGTFENYVRTRYSGNSAHFGTSPTISSLNVTSTTATTPVLTYTISGTPAGVTVSYVRATTDTKPGSPSWTTIGTAAASPIYITSSTAGSTTLSITPDVAGGSNYYYFFKVELSATASAETTSGSGVLVNKAAVPTVTINSVSANGNTPTINYTINSQSSSVTSVSGSYPISASGWATSMTTFPAATLGVPQIVNMNVPQTASPQTINLRVSATNATGTGTGTSSGAVVIPAIQPPTVTITAVSTISITYTLAGGTASSVAGYAKLSSSPAFSSSDLTDGILLTGGGTFPVVSGTGTFTNLSTQTPGTYNIRLVATSSSSALGVAAGTATTSSPVTIAAIAPPTVTINSVTVVSTGPTYTINYSITSSVALTTNPIAYYRTGTASITTAAQPVTTTSSAAVYLSSAIPTTVGANQTVTITIPPTASARVFDFRIDAANSSGTTASSYMPSQPLSVAAQTGAIISKRSFTTSTLTNGNSMTLVFSGSTPINSPITTGGTATLNGTEPWQNYPISNATITFGAPNASTRISTIDPGLSSLGIRGTLDFSVAGRVRLTGSFNHPGMDGGQVPFGTSMAAQYLDFT